MYVPPVTQYSALSIQINQIDYKTMFRIPLATAILTDMFITTALVWQINRPELLWNPQTKRYLLFYDIHIYGRILIPLPSS